MTDINMMVISGVGVVVGQRFEALTLTPTGPTTPTGLLLVEGELPTYSYRCVCVCMCMYVYVYVYMCMCMYMWIFVYRSIGVCVLV